MGLSSLERNISELGAESAGLQHYYAAAGILALRGGENKKDDDDADDDEREEGENLHKQQQ